MRTALPEQERHRGRHRFPVVTVLIALLLTAVVALLWSGVVRADPEREPTAQPLAGRTTSVASPDGPDGPDVRPVRVDIPAIAVHSTLLQLGLQDDGEIEVPPLARAQTAGWYQHSPAPGDVGPAVIVGHVDSDLGPAVFYRLASLRTGDLIRIERSDDQVAEFRVERVRSYPKDRFPTAEVYGRIRHAGLRLITCSGPYISSAGGYQDNTVVYATLHSLTPAKASAMAMEASVNTRVPRPISHASGRSSHDPS